MIAVGLIFVGVLVFAIGYTCGAVGWRPRRRPPVIGSEVPNNEGPVSLRRRR